MHPLAFPVLQYHHDHAPATGTEAAFDTGIWLEAYTTCMAVTNISRCHIMMQVRVGRDLMATKKTHQLFLIGQVEVT